MCNNISHGADEKTLESDWVDPDLFPPWRLVVSTVLPRPGEKEDSNRKLLSCSEGLFGYIQAQHDLKSSMGHSNLFGDMKSLDSYGVSDDRPNCP
jgi:hypothetical protein